ncbi:trypsin-like peptidase domain-containing protein, partial [bacterium]|nr:trypsin-like peptidase domain-containing protein [bacterium]
TNVHVLMGNNKMRFTNKDGKKIKPLSIETTSGRDIVRLKINETNVKALNIARPPANNTPIAVCGNSGGGGVIRTLYGKVLGSGPDKVETSAKFISGNSGSPILLENGNAIGIAAYVQQANVNWVNTNTPFTVARRFAYRIDNIKKWGKISPRTFVKESKILAERDEKLESLVSVLSVWANNPYWNRIQINDELPRAMTLWIDNQNEWVEHNHMRLKNTRGREANAKNLSRELIKELNGNVEFLKKSFKRSCSTKKRRWTVPFFKDYSDDMDRLQNILVEAIDNIAEVAAATDPVRLKKR